MTPILSRDAVAEIQGLYGPFSFPEKIFQKIWRRRDFDATGARLDDGRRLEVLHPGKLNLLGGPDFKGARLRFDGVERIGDVELHLHAEDWVAHGHAADPAYAGVVLHVVLFPARPNWVTLGTEGQSIPNLTVLPLLHHDLEEYAADEAVEVLANRPLARACEELGRLPPAELAAVLRRGAHRRWQQKLHFARVRLRRLGWTAACHHAALEILGYRFNRAPMLRIAGRHALAAWSRSDFEVEAILAEEGSGWNWQGVRPANHPRVRLRQYRVWTRARPDWPARLEMLAAELPSGADRKTDSGGRTTEAGVPAAGGSEDRKARGLEDLGSDRQFGPDGMMTTAYRSVHRLGEWRTRLLDELCDAAVGGTRFDNLCCDGFLPLLAAQTGRDLSELWFHWFPGDAPPHVAGMLRELGATGRSGPRCHGLVQGLWGWLLDREAKESAALPSLESDRSFSGATATVSAPHFHRVAIPAVSPGSFSGAGLDKFSSGPISLPTLKQPLFKKGGP